jgi:hypothetical protein
MELREDETGPLVQASSSTIRICSETGDLTTYQIPRATGDHGGGDERLLERLFGAQESPDPLGHMAGSWAGAMSVLIGVAANKSIASGEAVMIGDLLQAQS